MLEFEGPIIAKCGGGKILLKVNMSLLAVLFVLSFGTSTNAAVVEGQDYMMIPYEVAVDETETYTVVEGDNLFRIALANEIPLDTLMDMNELTGDLIHPGDELVIKGDKDASTIASKEREKITVASVTEQAPVKKKEVVKKAPANPPAAATASAEPAQDGVEMTMTATAYTAYCPGCSGTTAYGIDLRANPNQKVIAVDPRVIPLGSKVWIEGYGIAIAGDTGGAIKGNKIDVFIPSQDSALAWGVKKVKVKVLN